MYFLSALLPSLYWHFMYCVMYQSSYLSPTQGRGCVLFIFTSIVSSISICGDKSNSVINQAKCTHWKMGKRPKIFYRKAGSLQNQFPVTSLKCQAPPWPQTPSFNGLSVGAASCTPIRARAATFRNLTVNLTGTISAFHLCGLRGLCMVHISLLLCDNHQGWWTQADGERGRGYGKGGKGMLRRVTDSQAHILIHFISSEGVKT